MNTCPRFLIVFYQQHSLTMCSLTFLPRDTKYNREENADFAEHSIFVEGKWLEVQVMPFSLDSLCSELHLNYQWESSELYTFCGSLCQTHEPFSSCNSFSWICFHFPFGNFLSWVTLTSVCPETRRGPARLFGLLLWTCGVEEVTDFTGASLQPPWSIIYTQEVTHQHLCVLSSLGHHFYLTLERRYCTRKCFLVSVVPWYFLSPSECVFSS